MNRGVFVFAAVLLASLSGVRAADTTVPPPAGISSRAGEDTAFFESKIRPILVERCYECHSADKKQKGNLLLDSREGTLKGGDTAPAVVPGDPEKSLLIKAVRYTDKDLRMPPKDKKLTDAQIADLVAWVKMGAPDPRHKEARTTGAKEAKAKTWWAFQPVREPAVPGANRQNPIDAFVGEKLAAAGLGKAPPADRRSLLRRATFDLTGLPPTPEEIDAFVADGSDRAYEAVVERLLNSPAYGQRWARHWLDIVRYADYYNFVPKERKEIWELTEAWRYRDWVVDAFNRDLPFDQFIVHQIAGDRLRSPSGEEIYPEGLIATTFLSNGVWDFGDADKEKIVSDMVDDNIGVIGKAFLGLTLDCARCHDHKFDPISTEDYYGLAGMFYSSHMLKALGAKGAEYTINRVSLLGPAAPARRVEQEKRLAEIKAKLVELDKQPQAQIDAARRSELIAVRDSLQKEQADLAPLAMAVIDGGTPGGLFPRIQDVPIHIRGSYTKLGPVVPRRLPRFFAGEDQPAITNGSGRLELAAWVASRGNPLTARVIVNRVWQWHFGEGLVRTPSNFGLLSEPPSHPELLDWLATRFMEDGWSLKKLHRRIMLSATYRQGSNVSRKVFDKDPENRLLGRFTPRRLEAEAIRDAILSVNGQLDLTPGGPAGDDFTIRRRSLYVQTARFQRGSYANLFDAANSDASTEKRAISTVAPQALLLLNDPWIHEQARHLAQRLLRDVPQDNAARIGRAYRLLFGRAPNDAERTIAQQIIAGGDPAVPDGGWNDLAHVLLCGNEFIYID
ncbi:MAG: PSD1 and planctomycete cytochrome C domain-containing protein [Verrucomicrobiota bacterium]